MKNKEINWKGKRKKEKIETKKGVKAIPQPAASLFPGEKFSKGRGGRNDRYTQYIPEIYIVFFLGRQRLNRRPRRSPQNPRREPCGSTRTSQTRTGTKTQILTQIRSKDTPNHSYSNDFCCQISDSESENSNGQKGRKDTDSDSD